MYVFLKPKTTVNSYFHMRTYSKIAINVGGGSRKRFWQILFHIKALLIISDSFCLHKIEGWIVQISWTISRFALFLKEMGFSFL